jgi:hypothetical protein
VNVNNINGYGGYDSHYDGCCGYGWGGWGAAAAGAVVGAAVANANNYGTVVYALPAGCSTQIVNGITYSNCNGVWYQPQFDGTTTQYTVVAAP